MPKMNCFLCQKISFFRRLCGNEFHPKKNDRNVGKYCFSGAKMIIFRSRIIQIRRTHFDCAALKKKMKKFIIKSQLKDVENPPKKFIIKSKANDIENPPKRRIIQFSIPKKIKDELTSLHSSRQIIYHIHAKTNKKIGNSSTTMAGSVSQTKITSNSSSTPSNTDFGAISPLINIKTSDSASIQEQTQEDDADSVISISDDEKEEEEYNGIPPIRFENFQQDQSFQNQGPNLSPLSSEEEIFVKNIYYSGEENEEIMKKFNIILTRQHLRLFRGLRWLNDELINVWFRMLQNASGSKVYCKNTFFMEKLSSNFTGYDFQCVKRWTKDIDFFSFERILIPCHLPLHWTVAMIDFESKSIHYYDSMSNEAMGKTIVGLLKKYIEDLFIYNQNQCCERISFFAAEIKSIRKRNDSIPAALQTNELPRYLVEDLQQEIISNTLVIQNCKVYIEKNEANLSKLKLKEGICNNLTFYIPHHEEIPQQNNGSDCGVFCCKFAEFLARRMKIHSNSLSQKDMPLCRKRMLLEICGKSNL